MVDFVLGLIIPVICILYDIGSKTAESIAAHTYHAGLQLGIHTIGTLLAFFVIALILHRMQKMKLMILPAALIAVWILIDFYQFMHLSVVSFAALGLVFARLIRDCLQRGKLSNKLCGK